ncbi:hypothetical protein FACS1894208_09460 [Clostridia bacterium]|nr:hypothetical protein FACS1894208_09460 [Clostridia bacterium]
MAKSFDFNADNLWGEEPDEKEVSFKGGAKGGAEEIKLEKLIPYRKHMFLPYEGARLEEMLASVRENGVLVPILVRGGADGCYEILAGHNRVNVARMAGLDSVPAKVLTDISDEKADLIVTETNLCQRGYSDLKHSERAFALKMRHSALRKQGKRSDLLDEVDELINGEAPSESGYSGRSDVKVAEQFNLSPAVVSRYVKLSELHRGLLDLVDEGKIPFQAGVELAHTKTEVQGMVFEVITRDGYTADIKKAKMLREEDNLDEDAVIEILSGALIVKKKAEPAVKIKPRVYRQYFPDRTVKEVETAIDRALRFCSENAIDLFGDENED